MQSRRVDVPQNASAVPGDPGQPRPAGNGCARGSAAPLGRRAGLVVGLVVVAAAGLWTSLALTTRAVGYDTDSSVYLGVAHNLATGHGPTVPFTFYTDRFTPQQAFGFHGEVPSTHFPPLYPALLAVFEVAGLSSLTAVRVSGALLDGLNLVLFVLLLRRALVRRSTLEAVAAGAVLVFVGVWITAHVYALSEALMLAWTLTGLLVLTSYLVRPRRSGLVVLALCTAGAVLTRWVGASLGVTIALLVVARPGWPPRDKGARAAVVVGSLAFASAGWTLFGVVAGGSAPRLLAWHPVRHVPSSVLVLLDSWFFHGRVPGGRVSVLVVAILVVVALVATRPPGEHAAGTGSGIDQRTWVIIAVAGFGLVYLLAVLVARSFFDASIPTALVGSSLGRYQVGRIYLPLLPVALLLAVAALDQAASRVLARADLAVPVVVGACAAVALLPVGTPRATYRVTREVINGGRGGEIASRVQSSLRALGPAEPIASNVPDAVWGASDRFVLDVPETVVLVTGRHNPRFRAEVAQLSRILVRHEGVLVLRRGVLGSATEAEFACCSRLVPIARAGRDTAYRVMARSGP